MDRGLCFTLVLLSLVYVRGYDEFTACSRPLRGSRTRLDPPCDFRFQNWCTIPGSAYPWHAVRRFVYENQGLMRRMYGDMRQISVLRAELDTNDINQEVEEKKVRSSSTAATTLEDTTITTDTEPTTTEPPTTLGESTVSEEPTTEPTTTEPYQEKLFQDVEQEPPPQQPQRLRGVNACPVKEEVVAPFWANNTRGEVLALLNLYPFEQYVHWERCTYEHKQMFCRQGCQCEQQYRLHRLLAYDPKNECRGIFSDWFKFPSCCVCKCYDIPADLRLTSRSPRTHDTVTVGTVDAATPHFYYVPPGDTLSRSPRNVE